MARTYKRDSIGRFAGGGGGSSGGGSKRPAAKTVSRGVNRLTRDNAGKITSVGGSGATARGGRLRTAAGNKRATVTAKVSGGSRAGTMKGKITRDPGAAGKIGQGKAATPTPKPATAAPKPAATAKSRASQMRERAAQLDQRGNALMGGGRRDTAVVNLSLNSTARRNETNAGFKGLEMTRNAERLRSKAGMIEYRSNESRAKKLRSVHETPIAKAFAKKAGKSVTEVRAAIRSMTPEKQIKMFKQHVKETRSAATAKSRAAKPAAAAARTAAPKPAAAPKPKRRVFIRGNFRPQNVMANPAPDKTKYYKNQKGKNIAELEAIAKKAGANTQVVTKRKQNLAVAMSFKPMNLVRLNKASDFYANPRQAMRAQRRMGQLSTTDPRGVAFHELGHLRQKKKSENIFTQREFSSPRNARLAARVSQYAKTNANEFAAETYAGLKTGRRYDSQVMRAYREEMGLRPLSIRRQLKRSAAKRNP